MYKDNVFRYKLIGWHAKTAQFIKLAWCKWAVDWLLKLILGDDTYSNNQAYCNAD
jgi:hypothetical protein